MARAGSGRFDGLQAGRGIAALLVLISHTNTIVAEPRFYGHMLWPRLAWLGAGVDFFFVLSGFIIAWAHWGDIGRPDRLRRYAGRRFRRIYPPYWAVLLPLSLAYAFAPHAGEPSQHDPVNILFSLALLPYPAPPVLGVAWTLVYEMIFYALFGLVIVAGRRMLAALALWGVAILAANAAVPRLPFPASILLDTANLEFLFGIAAALLLRTRRVPAPALLAAAGAAGFVALMLLGPAPIDAPIAMRLGYGAAVAAGILGLVEIERTRGLAVPAFLRRMGEASYAIYLVHGVAISIALQLVVRVGHGRVPLPAACAVLVAAGLTAGFLFHHLVEAPLSRWMARARDQPARGSARNSSLP